MNEKGETLKGTTGINRYIMECKYKNHHSK